ncbi:MAG: response regulator transcription factor [Thermodesulfovibrio sp.]|nr:response regulator transcription factor [Thermodesulfovibrio sp.]
MIKLLIKIKCKLLGEVLSKHLENVEDIKIIKNPNEQEIIPDVIITDLNELTEDLVKAYSKSKIFLLDLGNKKEEILFYLVKYKLRGIFSYDSDINQFIKALRVVSQGQIWISNTLVQSLIEKDISDASKIGKIKLTEKEREIIQLVCEGFYNKEIAQKIYVSEQTVKAHLHKIFQKLNVKNRSQLIKLYIYNNR